MPKSKFSLYTVAMSFKNKFDILTGGVYVYVMGSRLTPLDSDQVVGVGENGVLPCLPAFPGTAL
jgi:hypothetical protein